MNTLSSIVSIFRPLSPISVVCLWMFVGSHLPLRIQSGFVNGVGVLPWPKKTRQRCTLSGRVSQSLSTSSIHNKAFLTGPSGTEFLLYAKFAFLPATEGHSQVPVTRKDMSSAIIVELLMTESLPVPPGVLKYVPRAERGSHQRLEPLERNGSAQRQQRSVGQGSLS